jgi:hypothetical protein
VGLADFLEGVLRDISLRFGDAAEGGGARRWLRRLTDAFGRPTVEQRVFIFQSLINNSKSTAHPLNN